ncbi:MAG: lipid-binding SYLF domain-containing protein, partial [Verrucomicrobiaceae bacterium]
MKTTTLCTLVSLLALLTIPVTAKDETSQVKQAAAIIQRFKSIPEKEIPREVLRDAKGLAILTVTKGGFVISGKYGEGVILARTPTGWSGPAFI